MGLFDRAFISLRDCMKDLSDRHLLREIVHSGDLLPAWPQGGDRNLVLGSDVGIELGHPRDESLSFVLWSENSGDVKNGLVSLAGPDLGESGLKSLPFGKVVLLGGSGFNEENSCVRHRALESIRFDVDLNGYMLRAASVYQREWIRISREALRDGFSLAILGRALSEKFRQKDYIDAVEILFVTAGRQDVLSLKPVAAEVGRIAGAMGKMTEEMALDCEDCEYVDVCNEVAELKRMRDALRKQS